MTPQYKDTIARGSMSLLSAHFILLNAFKGNTIELILRPKYAYSMSGSVIIALATTYSVCRVTRWLDQKYHWEEHFINRLMMQSLFGILTPMVAVIVLVTIYFAIGGWWILDTYWFSANLLPELLMLCVFNCYYMIYYLVVCRDRIFVTSKKVSAKEQRTTGQDFLFGKPLTEIVYIESTKEEQFAVFIDGKITPWKNGIKNGFKLLPPDQYMIGNRSEIFSFDNILHSEYTKIDKSMMRVTLIMPANKVIQISRENTSANKSRLKKYLK